MTKTKMTNDQKTKITNDTKTKMTNDQKQKMTHNQLSACHRFDFGHPQPSVHRFGAL